ncbi:ABC transporter permease [Heyndrickxia shackletonii]|uniref:ABC transporter permease n=1 Tax=Heyndrickxia shackletonii TaxID=157838 RepID=A0A0Q3TFR2_9BACI|nr:sugar ABC transporter permease [Heyndrickxia shackletonii]KQL52465.1 ABC transporter permease [Heyndrickxia shackletonii]NEY98967.1 ABC transporter permease subunit [Heyndrickxia shackletonii]
MPKKRKQKKSSEKIKAYALVAPALILIAAIAIWPVIQSFYFSLFDLKLNSPTKSETHLSYSFNLKDYLDNYPFLISGIDAEIRQGHAADDLNKLKTNLQALDKKIQADPDIKDKYKTVNEKLMNFEQIDSSLAFIKIDRKLAKQIQASTDQIHNALKSISAATKPDQSKKLLGLSSALNQVIVKPNFIGLAHYKDDLSQKRMWKALGNTFTFTVISVAIELILGLAIALVINKAFIGRGLIRASILIPWAIPTAVSALIWKFLYDGQNGVVAKIFEKVGLVDHMSSLLTTQTGAFVSVILSDVWKTTPYMALLLLAGLQVIPSSLYEAASIDGASKWKQFTNITLPLLKSSMLVALLFRTLDAFRVFDLIWVLTGGGPANSTETISIFAYKVMFSQTNFGNGSALAVIVFICVAIISMIYIKFLGKDLLQDSSGK